ncbi:aspartyl/asparaginyl beta-hydroxylase domain-containing protein [bacterium]|nr:aspartyl/asparaginyl beta-hydroxylase domain-containing protein [bacterium]
MELNISPREQIDFIAPFLNLNKSTQAFIDERIQLFADGVAGHELHKKLHIPFLKLSTPSFDHALMLKEALNVQHLAVGHRTKDSAGWKSLCLHGIEAKKTLSSDRYGFASELETPYQWTEICQLCPQSAQFLKSLLEQKYFERLFRVRFMYLEPGGYIQFHQDRDDMNKSLGPLNVALNMPRDCHWVFKSWGTVPFEPGSAYAVDISNQHGVWNFSDETRVHLIIHGRYGESYFKSIEEAVRRERHQLSQSTKSFVLNKKAATANEKTSFFANILWQRNDEISRPQLFSQCSNITEHFLRLKASRHHRLMSGIHLSDLLTRCFEQGNTWAFVCTPGLIVKDHFFSRARHFLSQLSEDVFVIGHLLDRKERWFGLHPQSFFINLKIWEKLGRPSFGEFSAPLELPNILRSEENVHDNYTPLYLRPKEGKSIFQPEVFGWNWVRAAMQSNFQMLNIPNDLREKKQFLYPEQNQAALEKRLTKINTPLNELKNMSTLSTHQEEVFEQLHIEAFGLDKKLFLFNTEQARSPYQEARIKKIDAFVGLPAGFMDMHLLHRHKLNENAQIIYFDINNSMLEIKKELFENWDGSNFPMFLESLEKNRPDIFAHKLMTTDKSDIAKKWAEELALWGSEEDFKKTYGIAKPLHKKYIQTDIVSSGDKILDVLAGFKNKHIALWYSNCFNYTPSLAEHQWNLSALRSAGVIFLNSVNRIAKSNKLKITVYGEDVVEGYKVPGFGTDIQDVFG